MYCLNKKFRIREEKDGMGLIADTSSGQVYVLNPVATTVLRMCRDNQAVSISAVVEQICNHFKGCDRENVTNDTSKFLNTLVEFEVLTRSEETAEV